MNPVAADLVATELRDALTAHTRAVSGPSSTAEADALDRLERATEAAAALLDLTSPPHPVGLGRQLPAGQSVLWLDISTGECGIRHGRVIGETRPQHYDIAVEAPWAPAPSKPYPPSTSSPSPRTRSTEMTDSRTRIHAAAWFATGAAATVTAAAAVTAWDMYAVTTKLRTILARAAMSPTERAAADRIVADLEAEQARLLADRDGRVEENRIATASQFRPDLMLTPVLDVADLSVQALFDELTYALNQLDDAYDRWINQGVSDGEAEATMWRGHVEALGNEVFNRRYIQHGFAKLSKADQLRLDIAEQKSHVRISGRGMRANTDPTA